MSAQTSHDTKTRCDRCRKKNLKCDRAIPACQNCVGLKDCKYTSQNHSHRGIPRCATCQKYGLKCDRDMPACNQCQSQGRASQCAYLPRRRRNAEDKITFEDDIGTKAGTILKFGFIDKNSKDYEPSQPHKEEPPSLSAPVQTLRAFSVTKASDYEAGTSTASNYHPDSGAYSTRSSVGGRSNSSVRHSRNTSPNLVRTRSQPQFTPLPAVILQTVSEANYTELPAREVFEQKMSQFLDTLIPEMQESTSLSSTAYMGVARYLVTGELPPQVSPYLQTWMTTHRLLPGSQTHPLILIPRDPLPEDLAVILQQYQSDPVRYTHGDGTRLPEKSIFDRLPVQSELYDILAYAHQGHTDSFAMADEARKMGFAHITWPMADIFARLCPKCAPKDSESGGGITEDD
ncbi:hypothetical protein BDP27DRAFT_1322790 [Rhodocollybia butyracea]|uniref:Zn(2)-C6 fungal-type domain-containing protein n=1 Tax=Rhodocollybia butyracea TaxID=206335 RepID=A0A9P5PW86_9AGAR|nr:hypothetical protein BDP27DRAFT_1322790 [Rhodocollybia butyracea]